MTYNFDLPPEEQVIKRNRTITTYYAQLYQNQPDLYKWAGMAAFASFHIGEKLSLWNWQKSGIKPLAVTCAKKNRSIEDDFQIIRIINNKIFTEIGRLHLAFGQLDYASFTGMLQETQKHQIVRDAFDTLQQAKLSLEKEGKSEVTSELIWEANIAILWHEQSEVVQPLFDRLSDLFRRAMTFFASFDYKINHRQTSWQSRSRFIVFMLFSDFRLGGSMWTLPEVTNLAHRWHWISNDLVKKWRNRESDRDLISSEISQLAAMEPRNLTL